MEVKRVFISYSNVDREIAEKIADILKNEGVEYFLGEKNIQWGNDIKNIINDTLANRITHEIVILSPASIKSQWVAYEIGFATAKDVIILPFLTHPSVEIPLFMKGYNYKVDLNDVRNYFRNEEKYMTIYNENGEKEEVEVVISFEFKDTHKQYVIYTKHETDLAGNITVYVSRIDRSSEIPALYRVDDEEEWSRVKEVIRKLAEMEDETSDSGQRMKFLKNVIFSDGDGNEIL